MPIVIDGTKTNTDHVGMVEPTFSCALEDIKEGKRRCRAGWNGKGMFIFLVKDWDFRVFGHNSKSSPNENPTLPFIAMATVDGSVVPWLASQTDILATDWREV